MLIHAMIQWPDIITETLWPFALRLAVELHNKTPGPSDLTPEEIFTGIKQKNKFFDFHPFGCPIFVLDPSLQQSTKYRAGNQDHGWEFTLDLPRIMLRQFHLC
jgi:hypothetical protein